MKKSFIALTLLAGILTGCSESNEITKVIDPANPIVLRSALQKRVSQDNDFAFGLLNNTIATSGEKNIFISPLSVSLALGMLRNGAVGDTKSDIDAALQLTGMSDSEINEYYKVLQTTLPGIDPLTKLSLANSIWYKNNFQVKSDFLTINSSNFNAYIKQIDFSASWAKDTINNWCAKKTNNLIKTIVDEVPSGAVMYLVNAVYFKGAWSDKFDKKLTTESTFTNASGSTVKVNMMSKTDTVPYGENDKAQYISLPYGNKAFEMVVVLPKDNYSVYDLASSFTSSVWNSVLSDMSKREVYIYIPRFKNEAKYTLNNELISMGMKLPFTDAANLTGIADAQLMVSKVVHKTYVDVNEDGTEAAAVTSIEVFATAVPEIPVFRADRPFLYAIRERSTGVILFIGILGNPEKY